MTTIEDKMKLFSKIVFNKIDEEIKEQYLLFENEREEKLKKEQEKIKYKRENAIKDIERKSNIYKKEMVSKVKIKSQQEILDLKEGMIENILEELKLRLTNYADTEEYKNYLYNQINLIYSEFSHNSLVLYLNKKDMKVYGSEIKSLYFNTDLEVRQMDLDIIGGFILEDKEKRFRIDNSFIRKIHDSKELIGMKVTEALI